MKRFYKESKGILAIIIVLAMIFQFVGPMVLEYSYADETVAEKTYEKGEEKASFQGLMTTFGAGETVTDAVYTDANIYGNGTLISDGIIKINELETLEYKVDFTIKDSFNFTNDDSLELDIAVLIALGEIALPDSEKSGRIIFEVDGENIDAAKFIIEDGKLKIVFDNGEALNGKKGRKGYVSIQFNVEGTSEEVELVEEISLVGTEEKTFIVMRQNSNVTAISKKGDYIQDADNVEWIVDINTELASLNNAVLTDDMPEGLKIEKIEMIDLKISTENITEEGVWEDIPITDSQITIIDDKNLEFVLGNLNRKAKRIKITTSIDDSKTGNLEFPNTAKLNSDNTDEISDGHTAQFNRITGISKSSTVDKDTIEWTIEFRGTINEGTSDIVDLLTLPSSTNLVLDKTNVTLDGVKIDEGKIEISGNQITFKDLPNSTELQSLKYTTKAIFDHVEKGSFDISNKATHNGKSAETSASISRGELASKDNGRIYGDNDGNTYIEWKIDINKNNENWKAVIIEEKIPEGFEFIEAKMGVDTLITSTIIGDYPVEINVGDILEKKTITIITKVTSDDAFIKDAINSARIKWKTGNDYGDGVGIIGGGISSGYNELLVEGRFTINRFNHNVTKNSQTFSYVDGTVDWRADYKVYDKDVENLKIEDKLTGDHEYDDTSIKVMLNGTELAPTTDYTLTFGGENKTLTINLIKKGNEKYNNIILTYKTKFDLSEIADIDNKIEFKNNITVTNGTETSDDASRKLNEYVSKNGRKTVSKQSGDNRVFNWIAKLNYKSKTIGTGEKIVDTLTDQQKYKKDTIKIYEAQLTSNGDLDKVNDTELVLDIDYSINFTEMTQGDGNGNTPYEYQSGMEISFTKNLTTPIILEYQTEAVGISKGRYENKISYNDKNYSASIGYEKHDKFISKELLNSRNGKVVKGDVLKWKLIINESLSEIHNFELQDIMSDGLIFIEDSLMIEPEVAAGNEPFVKTELDGENINKEGFKLTKNILKGKYTLTYETLVRGDKNVADISNNVKISGYSLETSLDNVKKYTLIGRSEAGGSGYSDKDYEINISKVDISGAPIKQTVEFKIITKTKIGEETYISEEELVTGNDGKIRINLEKNNYNRYYIKEVKAPEGYIVSDEEIEIVLNSDKKVEIDIVNTKKIEVTGRKIWVNGPGERPTVWFKLYRQIENQEIEEVPDAEVKVLASGTEQVSWDGLAETDINGNRYTFSVLEVDEEGNDFTPANYEKTEDGLTVTNTYVSPKTVVTGNKVWVNGPDERPTVWFKLYRQIENQEREEVPNAEIKALPNATRQVGWNEVDETDINGNRYTFSVLEVDKEGNDFKPANYGKIEDGLTVTNTYEIPKVEVRGIKEWIDGPEERPTVWFKLYRQIANEEIEEVPGTEVKKLPNGTTTANWTELDATDIDGNEYIFSVHEVNEQGKDFTPKNYIKTENGLEITNHYVSPTDGSAKAVKEWINGPVDRPTVWFKLYRQVEGGELEEVPESEAEIKELPSGITEVVWTELTKTDSLGNEYTFSVQEVNEEGEGFTPENYEKEEDGLTVTNTYVIPITEIKGTKIWIGGSRIKPVIELQLYRDNEVLGDPIKFEDGETEYTWTGLDNTDIDGNEYKYTIDEVTTPYRYRKSISEDGLTITNRYIPPVQPTDPDPVNPVPTDPEDPEEPEEPEEPTEPTEPTEPEKPREPIVTEPDTPVTIDPNIPEGGTVVVEDPPKNGTITFDEEGKPVYTPDKGFTGKDSFKIKVIGPDGEEEIIEIDIDIPEAAPAPEEEEATEGTLAKTGEIDSKIFYMGGLLLILAGLLLGKRKRA